MILFSFTNLRLANYYIEKFYISKVKMIPGKIVLSIALTTAVIVGIVDLPNIYFESNFGYIIFKKLLFRNVICIKNQRIYKFFKDGNNKFEKG